MKPYFLIVLVACLPLVLFCQSIETSLPSTDGNVAVLIRSGNDIYMAGSFTTVGSTSRNYLAKINATTGAVQSWNPDVNGSILCMALSADGSTLFIGGGFSMVGATTRNYLAAVNTTTGAVTSWNPSPDFWVEYMTLATDNTVYISGQFSTINNADGSSVNRNGMGAVDAAGNVTNFNPRPSNVNPIRDLAISSDNNTIFVGIGNANITFASSGDSRQAFAALNASDGTVTTWDVEFPSGTGVFDIEMVGTTLYMCGSFDNVNNMTDARSRIAKWNTVNTTPTLDATFDPPTLGNIRAIAFDGSALYAVGEGYKAGSTLQSHLFAFNGSTGSLLSTFNCGANTYSSSTRSKLVSNAANNRLYSYGSSGTNSLLGEAATYYHSLNLTGSAIAANANAEVMDAMGTVNYTLNSPQNTGIIASFTDPSSFSNPYIFGDRYASAPQNVSGVAETNVLPYRFIYHNVNVGATARVLKFKLSDIPSNGISAPANTKIYYRSTPSEGAFTSAGTVTYDAGAGTLSIDVTFISGLKEFIFATNDAIVLPVELMSFRGKNTEGGNFLTWATAEEKNAMDFEVERSRDGRVFEKIGFVKAKGSHTTYEFLDNNSKVGLNYYRLIINDLDKKSELSKTITIQSKQRFATKVYPSVTEGLITLEGATSFEILNMAGQIVVTEKSNINSSRTTLNLTDLTQGLYVIRGKDTEGGVFSEKIIKQ